MKTFASSSKIIQDDVLKLLERLFCLSKSEVKLSKIIGGKVGPQ